MNTPPPTLSLRALAAAVSLLLSAGAAVAQNPVEDNYRKAVQLMEDAKWADAASVLQSVVNDYGSAQPFDIYGPAFGLIHYHLGLCQMQLKKYKEAAAQFEITFKKFPNKIPPAKAKTTPPTRNHYHLLALYHWGRAEQGAEEYEGAIKLYNKFLSEKPERGTYSVAELYTNLGVCHARLGKVAEATGYIQKVYDAHAQLNTREKYFLHKAFFDLCDQWVEKAMVKDALSFMDKNDGLLRFSPFDSFKYSFNKRFLKLAQEASGGEDNLDALALRFFTLTPRTEDAITELQDRKAFYQNDSQKKKVQGEIDKLQATIDGGTAVDIPGLRLLAYIYEKNGSFRAAYAVHDYMSRRFPTAVSVEKVDGKEVKTPIHPEILYNATRCAFSFGDLLSAQHHGMIFLKKYPGHDLEPEVQSMLMEQLFRRGDYERCIKIASDILPKLPPGSLQHDLCLFCLGGSYYYDGQYENADPLLDQHAEKYPESAFLEESSYYHGANKVKLLEWATAAPLLEAWLGKYPDSSLRAFAILDRATCHFAMDELDDCLVKLDEIEQRYPDAPIYDRSLNLRGDVLQAKKEWAAAEESYKKGKARAESEGHYQVAAEALSQLVPVAIALENFEGAAAYYDEFTRDFAENYLEPQVVASALEALVEESVGRGQEGLDKMEDMIDRLGRQENADLEKAIAKYGDVSVELNGAEATIQRLKDMATKGGQPDAVQAWLLVSRIDIIEKEFEDGAQKTAAIRTAFNELRGFDKKQLAPYVLARIGDFLRAGGQTPQSVAWFEEILGRPGIDSKDYAYNALAKIYFRDAGAGNDAKGLEYSEWVVANSGNTKLTEESAYERARYLSKQGKWTEAEDAWFAYVSNKSWRANSPEAWFSLATARDKRGRVKEALSAYLQNIGKYPQYYEYSIPATSRSAELQLAAGETEKAFHLARVGGIRFKEGINDPEYAEDFAKLRRIFSDHVDQFLEEGQQVPPEFE